MTWVLTASKSLLYSASVVVFLVIVAKVLPRGYHLLQPTVQQDIVLMAEKAGSRIKRPFGLTLLLQSESKE